MKHIHIQLKNGSKYNLHSRLCTPITFVGSYLVICHHILEVEYVQHIVLDEVISWSIGEKA